MIICILVSLEAVEDIYKDFNFEIIKRNYWILLIVTLLAGYCYKSFLDYLIIE